MSVSVGLNQKLLTQGERFYAYSGIVQGDVSVPASISLINFTNGLRDAFVKIQPSYGFPASSTTGAQVGLEIKIDGISVYKAQTGRSTDFNQLDSEMIELFLPRQSTIEVISLNTSGNNTQDRGATLLGWYLA